jgi:hypothetical protein
MRVIVFVQNRIINDDQQRTPFELINGFKPNLSNLRILGFLLSFTILILFGGN